MAWWWLVAGGALGAAVEVVMNSNVRIELEHRRHNVRIELKAEHAEVEEMRRALDGLRDELQTVLWEAAETLRKQQSAALDGLRIELEAALRAAAETLRGEQWAALDV